MRMTLCAFTLGVVLVGQQTATPSRSKPKPQPKPRPGSPPPKTSTPKPAPKPGAPGRLSPGTQPEAPTDQDRVAKELRRKRKDK